MAGIVVVVHCGTCVGYNTLVFTKSEDSNLIGSCNSEYPWIFIVLRTERKMVGHFTKVSEEEIVVIN